MHSSKFCKSIRPFYWPSRYSRPSRHFCLFFYEVFFCKVLLHFCLVRWYCSVAGFSSLLRMAGGTMFDSVLLVWFFIIFLDSLSQIIWVLFLHDFPLYLFLLWIDREFFFFCISYDLTCLVSIICDFYFQAKSVFIYNYLFSLFYNKIGLFYF